MFSLNKFRDVINVIVFTVGFELNLECGGSPYMYLCPGELVEINCFVNSTVMRWTIEENNMEQSRRIPFSKNDRVGKNKTRGPFTAVLNRADNETKESTLSFIFNESLNGTFVICERARIDLTDTCHFFISGEFIVIILAIHINYKYIYRYTRNSE